MESKIFSGYASGLFPAGQPYKRYWILCQRTCYYGSEQLLFDVVSNNNPCGIFRPVLKSSTKRRYVFQVCFFRADTYQLHFNFKHFALVCTLTKDIPLNLRKNVSLDMISYDWSFIPSVKRSVISCAVRPLRWRSCRMIEHKKHLAHNNQYEFAKLLWELVR